MTVSKPLEDNFKATLIQQLDGDAGALTMYMSKVPVATIPVGFELVVTINPGKGFTGTVQQENVLVESIDTVNKTMTVKAAGRAQNRYNGDSPTAQTHAVGSTVIISDAYPVWDALDDFVKKSGDRMTGALEWNDANTYINEESNDMVFKSDSQAKVTLSQLAAGAGVNDKAKVSVNDTTAGYLNDKVSAGDGLVKSITNPAGNEVLDIDINLEASNPSLQISSDELGVKIKSGGGLAKDSGGLYVDGAAKFTGAGVANTTTADQDALSFAGNTRLNLADANESGLDAPWLFAGIANGASSSGNTQNLYPYAPIVTVPAFTVAQRAGCRLWDGQTQATSNTTSDAPTATTEWRAQTFTPATGEDNVSAIILNLTKTGSPAGNFVVSIRATSGGLPTGADLGSVTVAHSTLSSGDNTFNLATPLALTPGTVYAIIARSSSGLSGGNTIAWNYQNSDVYASGQSATSTDSGANWSAQASFDRRFKIQYRGIAGEPVFLSDTAGDLQLTPGTYPFKVGEAVSTTQIMLNPGLKSIYATYNYTVTAAGTVDTEITTGFRPMLVIAGIRTGGSSPGPGGMGSWMNAGGSFSVENKDTLTSSNGAVQHFGRASNSLLSVTGKQNNTGPVPTDFADQTLTVQATSGDSITIRRVITITGTPSVSTDVYLNIIGF